MNRAVVFAEYQKAAWRNAKMVLSITGEAVKFTGIPEPIPAASARCHAKMNVIAEPVGGGQTQGYVCVCDMLALRRREWGV